MPFSPKIDFRSYKRAKAFVRKLGLKSAAEYQQWAAGKMPGKPTRPSMVPSNPHQAYLGTWKGYSDWLGTNHIANFRREFVPYDQARAFVVRLGLQSGNEWDDYSAGRIPRLGTRPAHIPSNPNMVYRDFGWCGIRHWLGIGGPVVSGLSKMLPFDEARSFARLLGLPGQLAWRKYVAGGFPELPERPPNIPTNPNARYKNEGWLGYGDFLGTNNVANHQINFRPFLDARDFARSLKFTSKHQWQSWAKASQKPVDIPANPERAYSSKWRGWKDWLKQPFRYTRSRDQP